MINNIITLFIITVSVGFGEPALLNVGKCSYGPAYWCSSIIKAKECNAMTHCIQTVWEKQTLPEDNDDICQICKEMVTEARDQLESNETQEELKQVFEGSCRLIPLKEVANECVQLADEFVPELIETLASQMNPQVVCATAGLCNSVRVDRMLREYKKNHPGKSIIVKKTKDPAPGDCKDCESFVNDMIRLVKNHDPSETLNRLLAICGSLGSISDACMGLVQANFQAIYNFLAYQLKASEFCDLVGMCERMYGKKAVTVTKTGDEACDFCVAIVKHWKDVLTANTTEEEFKEILDGLCKQTGSFKDECLSIVDNYYLPLYQMLTSAVHPKEICEGVGLCGLSSVFNSNSAPIWTLHNLRPEDTLPIFTDIKEADDDLSVNDIASDNEKTFELPRVKLQKPDIQITSIGNSGIIDKKDNVCIMCEFTLHFIQNVLHDNVTREEIEEAVINVCQHLPKTVAEECEDYVDAYGNQVIDLLSQEIDPSIMCPMLGLCHQTKVEVVVKDDTPCIMCEFAITQLKDMIKDNKTEAAIKHSLENLCKVMPKTVRKDCVKFVDTYSDQVIKLLLADLDPDQVCTALGLCDKVNSLPTINGNYQLPVSRMFIPALVPHTKIEKMQPMKPKHKVKQSAVCVLCEFVMTEVDEQLTTNHTMDEIEKVLEFICAHLPGTVQEDCIGFVEEYGDSIIQLVTNQLDPREVCQELTLCKPSAISNLFKATLDLDVDKCLVCEEIVNFVDEKLQEPDTTTDIDDLLENICAILPEKVRPDCRDVIEVYGPYVVNMLIELGHDSKKVCQAMELCPNHITQPLLGASKCTWGPSYWCQTQLHAKACQATSHCEDRVWGTKKPLI